MACLPMADWYVLRGLWLWSGKGTMEAHTPRIMAGWICRAAWQRRLSLNKAGLPCEKST